MIKKFRIIIYNRKGLIDDIREAEWCYYFRKDGSFTAQINRVVQNCLENGGKFTIESTDL